MQPPDGVLESCLYARDLEAAERFYATVIGLVLLAREPERHCFFRCGQGVVLIFDDRRTSRNAGEVGGVAIPTHGTGGRGHIAFRVFEAQLPAWRERLTAAGVPIEADVAWPHGGRSLYLRDPAGNSVELATPSVWGLSDETPAGLIP
jgi:catechol 2,3-dioxygenase-like lactoylglutathione lyase family enzyme